VADFDISVVINRPIEMVFSNTTCLKGCVNWFSGVRSAEKLNDEPAQVGSRYKHSVGIMGISTEAYPTITAMEAPHHFAFADTSNANYQYDVTYTFEETPEGTQVKTHVELQTTPSALGRIAEPILVIGMKRQFQNDLHTLKDLLENDIAVQAT